MIFATRVFICFKCQDLLEFGGFEYRNFQIRKNFYTITFESKGSFNIEAVVSIKFIIFIIVCATVYVLNLLLLPYFEVVKGYQEILTPKVELEYKLWSCC